MREYTTLTREAVDVVEGAAQYMSETTPMEHWSDKMLDLLLNGPTINGIKKDEVRALLRQTYAALKRYEVIGPMASPFMNDPPPSSPSPSGSCTRASNTTRSTSRGSRTKKENRPTA